MKAKKFDFLKSKVLIIGNGAGGLSTAFHLEKKISKDSILISYGVPNSILSPWNMMIKEREILKKEMLESGCNMNNKELVDVFLSQIPSVIQELRKMGIKLRKSNIGLVPDYPLPGKVATETFLQKIKEKGIKIIKGKAEKFVINEKREIVGVLVKTKKIKQIIFFDYLVLSGGGVSGLFKYTTGSKSCDGSLLGLSYEANLTLENIEFFMFHPFLIVDPRFPRILISGEILTKMKFENELGRPILSEKIEKALRENRHHYIFPEMVKEFYLASLTNKKIFGKLICSESWFEKFKKYNEFGYIFKNFSKKEIEKIEIHPAFHFTIGGISINKNAQTSQKNVYAVGEIAGGLHGANRIGGLAILEALIFGKIAAMHINKSSKNSSFCRKKFQKLKLIGNLGISEKMKEKVWESLGPLKNQKSLLKFYTFLRKKKKLSSQEKLLKKIVKISLLRKNSVGAFFKENAPIVKKDKRSFIIEKKIVFK
jgi:aspartate oxidase